VSTIAAGKIIAKLLSDGAIQAWGWIPKPYFEVFSLK